MRRTGSAQSDSKRLKPPRSVDKLKSKLNKENKDTLKRNSSHEKMKTQKKSKATPENDLFRCQAIEEEKCRLRHQFLDRQRMLEDKFRQEHEL